MHIVFSEQGNAIEIIKKFRWFVQFESYFVLYAGFSFLVLFSFGFLVLFSKNKTLRWIDLLFVSNFLQWLGSVGKFMFFQLYRSIYGVMFAIFSGCSPILKWFNAIITAYWKHLCFRDYCFALILLIQLRIYVWSAAFKAFLWVLQNISSTKSTQIHCPSLFVNLLGIYARIKNSVMISSVSSPVIICKLKLIIYTSRFL